jgi:type IV/VI secretion system ImpK/VasF family protein
MPEGRETEMERGKDYTTELFRLASPLFLFLVSFRRKVQKKYPVSEPMVTGDLEELFARMDRKARTDVRLESLYEKAKYPLVVLADEVLLHSDWEHTTSWEKDHLLEEKYFHTNIGGDKIFQLASELRYEEVEMAAILFTAIALGVRGTYHRKPEKLAEIRSKLYRQMSEYLADSQHQLTPEAYHVTARQQRKISPAVTLGRVAIVGAGLLALYWFLSWGLWTGAVHDLKAIVDSFSAQGAAL